MDDFAERTGLTGEASPRRYLWTDAFAVCNFIALARATGDTAYHRLALDLVAQVHHVLGRHRSDDRRRGWISGLAEADGEAHPTLGGLRIGKRFPERAAQDRYDETLEWERDGQYFHYLTKWMVALDRLALATGDPRLHPWACELADSAHRRFAYAAAGEPRLYWKMSIDLGRPLVPSMGHHDPLDGLVTYLELGAPELEGAIASFARMIDARALATADPLGIGGLLIDAHRLTRLLQRGVRHATPELLGAVLAAAATGLAHFIEQPMLRQPAFRRLAFRELGLAIGLSASAAIEADALDARSRGICANLARYAPLRDEIEGFWRRPEHRETRAWIDHADINEVMLATTFVPGGLIEHPAP